MKASVNIIAVLHQIFFCFSSHRILRTSAESIAAKRQSFPTKEKPETVYYAGLHKFKKRISSHKLPDYWQPRPHFPKKQIL